MGDDRALHCETFDVSGLFGEKTQGDEEREVGVLVTGRLEALVEPLLHLLPDRVPVRLDDHAPADHFGGLGEVTLADDVLVPLGEISIAGGDGGAGPDSGAV